ncbi:hypothetical protein V6N11_058590 [Hibiscus sabdariffa]|uniref:Transmembrane protein n=1 Tax=Hibiscus sabdariffa TaxID=183260 RepID=A0ABR2U4P1_9ROSI
MSKTHQANLYLHLPFARNGCETISVSLSLPRIIQFFSCATVHPVVRVIRAVWVLQHRLISFVPRVAAYSSASFRTVVMLSTLWVVLCVVVFSSGTVVAIVGTPPSPLKLPLPSLAAIAIKEGFCKH